MGQVRAPAKPEKWIWAMNSEQLTPCHAWPPIVWTDGIIPMQVLRSQ
jgi:hypothetical protein